MFHDDHAIGSGRGDDVRDMRQTHIYGGHGATVSYLCIGSGSARARLLRWPFPSLLGLDVVVVSLMHTVNLLVLLDVFRELAGVSAAWEIAP